MRRFAVICMCAVAIAGAVPSVPAFAAVRETGTAGGDAALPHRRGDDRLCHQNRGRICPGAS